MRHAAVTRPPRFHSLEQMRKRSSAFDSTSDRSGGIEVSSERRAKVKVPQHKKIGEEADNSIATSSRPKIIRKTTQEAPDYCEEPGSIVSNWSKSSLVEPLFEGGSILSAESTETLFRDDDPWRAAKRGDLSTLKQFHTSGKVDWLAKDDCQNIPLHYACHSGAIADIMVVPFLLWVTDLRDEMLLERCSKYAINRQVRSILKAHRKGGLSAIATETSNPTSVDSRHSNKQVPKESLSFNLSTLKNDKISKGANRTAMAKPRIRDAKSRNPPKEMEKRDSSSYSSLKNPASVDVSKQGSRKSTIFEARRKSKGDETVGSPLSAEEMKFKNEEQGLEANRSGCHVEEASVPVSRLHDDESSLRTDFSKTKKPPLPFSKDEKQVELPPSSHTFPTRIGNSSSDHRDDGDSKERDIFKVDERSDWDRPIEQNRNIGRQAVAEMFASYHGGNEDSWSIGSMLSLKRWQSNWKNLEQEKFDKILGTHIEAKYGEGGIHSEGSMPGNSLSFDSALHRILSPNRVSQESSSVKSASKARQAAGYRDTSKPYAEYY